MIDRQPACPDCTVNDRPEGLDRRNFIRVLGARAAAVALGSGAVLADAPGLGRRLRADDSTPAKPKPAEALIKELYSGFTDEQKKNLVLPFNHEARLRTYNAPALGKSIGANYTKPQQELLERILKAISSDDEGFKKLTRNGTYDTRGGFQGCGALLFGEPTDDQKFAWVFSGHHLTVRCDGNSEEGAAFGGPMYYGHSPNGLSDRNCFHYQTKAVLGVHDALSDEQRKKAVIAGSPTADDRALRFRKGDAAKPGIAFMDLTKDQRLLVESVMRSILSPYRKEDADEVMDIVKANGGLDKLHLAFYKDRGMADDNSWHFWRLEGPGFVWNYRVLPHVHTFVNISSKI